jgi:hypothetical protein
VIKPLTAIVAFHWLLMGALLLPVDLVLKVAGLLLGRSGPVRSVPFRRWARASLTWLVYPLTTALLVKRCFRTPLAGCFDSTLAAIDPRGAAELKERPASKVLGIGRVCVLVFHRVPPPPNTHTLPQHSHAHTKPINQTNNKKRSRASSPTTPTTPCASCC